MGEITNNTEPRHTLSPEEVQAMSAMGWYLDADAKHLGAGGGGACYLCLNASILGALRYGFERGHGGLEGLMAAKSATLAIANHVLTDTATAVVKIQHKTDPRTLREISAMKAVSHPNLMKILAHDTSVQPRWFVMERHGTTLDAIAPGYVGNPMAAFEAILPIAGVLERLHAALLFHRDVKPRNVFVARDGRLVLGDLGVVLDPNAERLTEDLDEPPLSRDWIPPWPPEDGYDAKWDLFMLTRTAMFLVAGAKLKHNSWLSRDVFSLPTRFPNVQAVDAVQDFFRRAFVDDKTAFPWSTAAEFKYAVGELIDKLSGRSTARLIWSAWVDRATGSRDIVGAPVFISVPCRRLRAKAIVSRGPLVGLQLTTVAENSIVVETEMVQIEGGDKVMSPEFVLQRSGNMIEPGWYRLNVRVHGPNDGRPNDRFVEGITVYGE